MGLTQRPLDKNPTYVAAFVLLLVLPQGAALAEQARLGYRPFAHAPQRVPLSWDMFSTAITRCDVHWDPPLLLGERRLGSLREAGRALEWDPVYDTLEDYTMAAQFGCLSGATQKTRTTATLECFTFEGQTVHDAFRCR